MDILVPTKRTKMVAYLKLYQNAFAGGTLPKAPLGKLAALPRPPSWTWWHFWRTEEAEDKKREEMEEKGKLQKGRRDDWPKRVGVGLPSLKCDCLQASLAGCLPERVRGVGSKAGG